MASQDIDIIIQAKDMASKALNNVSESLNGVQKSIVSNQDTFKKMATFGAAAFATIGYGVKKVVDQASDLEETTQKFNVVYRDLGDAADQTAKSIAEGYGLSQKASKQFLADLGDVTSGFGLSQEASLEYAKQVTEMGVDLASFANIAGGSEEAIDRLNKGFLGEHENLKALGIIINDTMLKKQLLADGTSKLTGLELEQAKIQARMTIAMSQSQNAVGDFERSKSSLANQTRILQSNMEDLTTNLGTALLPVITQITTSVIPVIEKFATWAENNPELTKTITIATLAIAGIITVLGTLGLVIPLIITGVGALGTALAFLALNPIGMVITAIAAGISIGVAIVKNWEEIKSKSVELGGKLIELYDKYRILFAIFTPLIALGIEVYKNWDLIKQGAYNLGVSISQLVQKIIEFKDNTISNFVEVKNRSIELVESMGEAITSRFDAMTSAISSALRKAKDAAKEIVTLGFAKTETFNGSDGTRANGGPVKAGNSYLVGERGPELFTPKTPGSISSNDSMGGGGVTINMGGVIVQNSADENRLMEKMKTMLKQESKAFNLGIA